MDRDAAEVNWPKLALETSVTRPPRLVWLNVLKKSPRNWTFTRSARSKLFASEALTQAALGTLQVHGGYGYLTDLELERALRDAIASTIYSGTSETQRNIIARWLGL